MPLNTGVFLTTHVGDEAKKHSLLLVMLKMHSRSLLLAVPSRILFSVCMFAQPLLINHIVGVVGCEGLTSADKHSLVFATGLVYGGIGVSPAFQSLGWTLSADLCSCSALSILTSIIVRSF